MFYDVFLRLCADKQVAPSKAAEDIGLSRAAVAKWKKGGTPSAVTALKLSDYFGVSVSDLLQAPTAEEEKPSTITVRDEDGELIVLDDETLEYIDSLRARPEMKMLFSVSKKATKEDIIKAVKIIEALKDESEKD